ncbi:MAG TPA: enoyl-CoA hydratase-related protein, partial [Ktedonobacterales bacterium]
MATAPAVAYESIQVERDGEITTITMNRPDKRNALSTSMMSELLDAFKAAGRNPDTRAVILAANGPAFSAGHDLSEMVDGDINTYRAVFDLCTELMTAIQSIPQPVIARVHKLATAAGCQLVATCDLA